LLVPLALAVADDPPRPDPLPLRRVHVSAERALQELDKAQKGVLVLLPRADFEAKVQQAALAKEQAATPPRLLKTWYRAALAETALVGDAEWQVLHTGPGPGLLPVPDFNLALSTRPTGGAFDPVLGDLDGKSAALWVEKPGRSSVYLDWTRRGTPVADGLQFDLEVPACANAQLELRLFADRRVLAKAGTLVTGPEPTANPWRRTWRLSFTGRSRVEFTIRRVEPGAALMLVTTQSRQELSPDRVLADFDFQIETLHGSRSEAVFEASAGLLPYEVTLGGAAVKGWDWRPAASADAAGQLVVPLPDSVHGVLPPLRVRCLAPAGAEKKDRPWVSPGLALQDAIHRGETLRLLVLPEAQLDGWKPGHFRLTRTAEEPDGTQVFTLVHGGSSPARPPASVAGPLPVTGYALAQALFAQAVVRPSAVLRGRATDVLLQQQCWWQVDPAGSSFTCELVCKPLRGRLYHVPLKLPPESRVDQLTTEPRQALQGWAEAGTTKEPLLLIDLAEPATQQAPVRVKLRLHVPPSAAADRSQLDLNLPDVEPLVAGPREGSLSVSVHPHWRAELLQSTLPPGAAVDGEVPWHNATPDYHFAFRGTAPAGKLRLVPRPPHFQARLSSDAYVGGDHGLLVARLTVEPGGSSLDHLDLVFSAPMAGPWKVRAEQPGARVAATPLVPALGPGAGLLLLAPQHPLHAAVLTAPLGAGERWRLRFDVPLRARTTLILEIPFDPAPGAGPRRRWTIPVPQVLGADAFEADLSLQLAGAAVVSTQSEFVETQRPSSAAQGKAAAQTLWGTFRYSGTPAPGKLPQLRLLATAAPQAAPAGESCDSAILTTYAAPGEPPVHHFRFRLLGWRKRDVPVVIPLGATVLAARAEGRWLTTVQVHTLDDGVYAVLPAGLGPEAQTLELYFTTADALSTYGAWDTLTGVWVRPPLQPLDLRRRWVLPPGVVPLRGAWRRTPAGAGPLNAEAWDRPARALWQLGQLPALADGPAAAPWFAQQKHYLAAGELALRKQMRSPEARTLGAAVEALALDHLQDRVAVVVDAEGLTEAGLSPASSFPASEQGDGWALLKLAWVPTPGGLLLTTRGQAVRWGSSATGSPLAGSVRQAAESGHDGTGRFFGAAAWARSRPSAASVPGRPHLLPESFGDDWTVWEADAGLDAAADLVVVRPTAARLGAAALAAVAALLGWRLLRPGLSPQRVRRARGLLVMAAALALAWVWLPLPVRPLAGWPAVALAAVLALRYFGPAFRGPAAAVQPSSLSGRTAAAGAAVALVIAAWLAAWQGPAWSQPPEVNTVLVLPGPADNPERQDVLVTPELLKKLDALTLRGPAVVRGAVLVGATYDLTPDGNRTVGKAEFDVVNFADSAMLTVPLTAVELRDGAELDGAAVFPEAVAAGYAVLVKNKGPHRLTLNFFVRHQVGADGRELVFGIPRLHQARLTATLAPEMTGIEVVAGLGRVVLTPASDAEPGRLTADIGREATIHLRWPAAAAGPAAKVSVRELYSWDLRAPEPTCTALLRYSVQSGKLSRLALAVPDTLEPVTVEVGDDGKADETARPRLRAWRLRPEGGQWRLHVELQTAVSSDVVLTVRFVPRLGAGPAAPRLALPQPLGVAFKEGWVAVRADGLDVRAKGVNLLTLVVPAEQFAKQWLAAGGREAVAPAQAFSFRNRQADAALTVTLAPHRPAVEQDLQWLIHADHADLQAALKATAAGDELLLLEWEVPAAVTVAEVSGEDVRSWSRAADGRVQIWLKPATRSTVVRLRGWASMPKAPPGQPPRWVVPVLRCPDAAPARTVLRVAATPGLRVGADTKKFLNLAALPGPAASWVNTAPQGFYRAEFVLRPEEVPAQVAAATTVEVRDGLMHLTGYWQVQVPHGGPAAFRVHASGWPGPLTLDGPVTVEPASDGEWRVIIAAGAPRQFQLKLAGTYPCPAATVICLPQLTLTGAVWVRQWVVVPEANLTARVARGLGGKQSLAAAGVPPALVERLGPQAEVWPITGGDWELRMAALAPSAMPGLEVLLAEYESAYGQGTGWHHQATYLLAVKNHSEVVVDLPAGATVAAAAVDGEPAAVRAVAADRVAVPLPLAEGLRRVRLRWTFPPDQEPLATPRLERPQPLATGKPLEYWTVTAPPDYVPVGEGDLDSAAATARLEAARAEAFAAAAGWLAEQYDKGPTQVLKGQMEANHQRFVRAFKVATASLAAVAGTEERERLQTRLARAQQREAAAWTGGGLEKTSGSDRAAAATRPAMGVLPTQGMVVRGAGPPPALRLESLADVRRGWQWTMTWVVLTGLALLLGLSMSPRLSGPARLLWPEAAAALALVAWWTWGFSLIGVLVLVGVAALRAAQLTRQVQHWWPKQLGAAGSSIDSSRPATPT
jgi:hypothetical protein